MVPKHILCITVHLRINETFKNYNMHDKRLFKADKKLCEIKRPNLETLDLRFYALKSSLQYSNNFLVRSE